MNNDGTAPPDGVIPPPHYTWIHTDHETGARVTIRSSDVTAGAATVSFAPTGGADDPHRVHLSPITARGLVTAMTGDHGDLDHASAAYALAARLQAQATADFLLDHRWGGPARYASHRAHTFHHGCAICAGDVPAILQALAQRIVEVGTEGV